jgi:hypothetical protein
LIKVENHHLKDREIKVDKVENKKSRNHLITKLQMKDYKDIQDFYEQLPMVLQIVPVVAIIEPNNEQRVMIEDRKINLIGILILGQIRWIIVLILRRCGMTEHTIIEVR